MLERHLIFCLFVFSDINECISDTDGCHYNASCNNTIGSYTCKCKPLVWQMFWLLISATFIQYLYGFWWDSHQPTPPVHNQQFVYELIKPYFEIACIMISFWNKPDFHEYVSPNFQMYKFCHVFDYDYYYYVLKEFQSKKLIIIIKKRNRHTNKKQW